MRTISSESLAKLAQEKGTEPVNIVEIQWVPNGPRVKYADKPLPGGIKPSILELGGLDTIIQISGGSDSTQINLLLDDTDFEIKPILDTADVNKRPVWVYQWFQDLDLDERFLIFRGEIRSPLIWDEGARTVSFTVLSKIEDAEVGFSIEEGNFPQPPDDMIGKPWPLCFGTVCDIPALQATSPRQGILKSGVGISDYTLPSRICQAGYILCPAVKTGEEIQLKKTGPAPNANGANFAFVTVEKFAPDTECINSRCQTLQQLKFELAQQQAYEFNSIDIIGGEKFPQTPAVVTIDINGAKFTGAFNGQNFVIFSRQHPERATKPPGVCREIKQSRYIRVQTMGFSSYWARAGGGNTYSMIRNDLRQAGCNEVPQGTETVKDGGASGSQKAYDDMPTSNFFWAQSGSRVTLDGEEEILYIANLLPSTINRVSAKRRLSIGERLLTLPESMYDIYETDYVGYTVTELLFPKLPSLTPNPVNGKVDGKWGDEIFVSLTSSVGPNTVDILEWLIEKYTTFNVDSASFAAAHAQVADYPSNFALLSRPNIVALLEDVAYQSRCAVFLRDDTVFIKYLPIEPSSVATISEDDILVNSLKLLHTDTEDVVTKSVNTWKKSGAQERDDEVILRHNVNRYGTQEESKNYFIYNVREHVLKSATFWLIRKASVWRRVSFTTTIKHLALEIFDCVSLDLPDLSPAPIKAIVEKATFDSANRTIDFECWVPCKAGTTTKYDFAWPAGLPAGTTWPTAAEIANGDAGSGTGDGYIMVPPPGHILSHTTTPGDNRADWGDRFPSDLDDSIINIVCPDGQDVDLEDETAPVFAAFARAASADRAAKDVAETGGAGGGGSNFDKKDSSTCGGEDSETGGCEYAVRVTYGIVVSVRDFTTGFPADSGIGELINAVETVETCHTFGSKFFQEAFIAYMLAQIDMKRASTYVGEYIPIVVANAGSSGPGPECEAQDQGLPNASRDIEIARKVKDISIPNQPYLDVNTPAGKSLVDQFVPPYPTDEPEPDPDEEQDLIVGP